MHAPITTFDELLAPTSPDDFFAKIFAKTSFHIKGGPDKFASVMNWDGLNRILRMSVWSAKTLQLISDGQRIPPAAYSLDTVDRNGHQTDQPDPERVTQLLGQGAALLLNEIETLHPGVLAVARCLERTFGAKSCANLYCSWQARQAFDSHFDRHEVFALQVVGSKHWRLYQGRVDNPIEHELFHNVPQAEYDRMKGPVAAEIEMQPGDLLYLPRGQFHDALASSSASIHVTFGVSLPTGLDWLHGIWAAAVRDSTFRADMPLPGDDQAFVAHVDLLMRRLSDLALDPAALVQAKLARADFGIRSGDYDLPNFGDDRPTDNAPARHGRQGAPQPAK